MGLCEQFQRRFDPRPSSNPGELLRFLPDFDLGSRLSRLNDRRTDWKPFLQVHHWVSALPDPYYCHHSLAHQLLVHFHPDPYTYSGCVGLLEHQAGVGKQVAQVPAEVLRTSTIQHSKEVRITPHVTQTSN